MGTSGEVVFSFGALVGSSALLRPPQITQNGKCKCIAPQQCDGPTY